MLGRHHPLLKRVRALRRSRRQRREEGICLAEGPRLVEEALACGAEIETLIHSPALLERTGGGALLERARAAGCVIETTSDAALDSAQDARSPQPVLALVGLPRLRLDQLRLPRGPAPPFVAVAHAIQDPGNLGTIARSAAAAGAAALLVCGESADLFHPRALRASMGGLFRLPAVESSPVALGRWIADQGLVSLGADARRGEPYDRAPLDGPLALVLGGETAGLPSGLPLAGAVRIPMHAGVDSLSVGAAAAVLLFEIARRRALSDRDG